MRNGLLLICFFSHLLAMGPTSSPAAQSQPKQIILRAWGVPEPTLTDADSKAVRQILRAFQARMPNVTPISPQGLDFAGGLRTMNIVPLMQIAGDIAPDVLYVNFRKSSTYVNEKFLYPLDRYIEQAASDPCRVARARARREEFQYIPDAHLMKLEDYLAELKKLPRYQEEIGDRVPRQCWQVMRRECPYGHDCPYCLEWDVPAAEKHYHVWCFPEGPLVMALSYRRDILAEAELPDRAPKDWDELLDWCRQLTNPPEDKYGLFVDLANTSWSTLSFLYSMGGLIVDTDENGQWHCVFDSDEAVEAYYFVARLFVEPFQNKYGTFNSVAYPGDLETAQMKYIGMEFVYIDERFFGERDVNLYGFGAVPLGPTGKRGSEFNCRMAGIYAGISDKEIRDAAWEYIRFYDGPEARSIRADVFVEEGLGQFLQPSLLRAKGYEEYLRQVPAEWEEAFAVSLKNGVPEPYGDNCDMAYR